ncbi:MAG: hypothetical protein LBP53_06195 [Candidatus Peribacteria bacterium]|nr:hypothetical protein [Candidatus Peribacteria bacterium]
MRYDISAEQPQLEINDFLHKQDSTTFQLGMHNFRGTGYLLPSQADINNNLIATYQKTGEKLMETTSFTDFQKKLQTNFETSTDELFGHKELAQLTMERQIRKDATAQKLIPLIQAIKGKIEYTAQNLSEELKTNTHLQNFIRYGDNFLETASIDEIQRFQWCIEQLTIKAKNPDEHPHYSPLLQRFQSADGTFDIFGLFEGLPGYKEFITNPDEHKQDFSLGIEELYSLLQDDNQPTLAQHNTSHYSKLYNQYTQQLETKEKGNVDKDLEIQLEATFGTTTFYA